jgi:DNA-binding LytR/AlgR family response regulator
MLFMLILNLVCLVIALFFSDHWSGRAKGIALGAAILPWTLPLFLPETTAQIGFIVLQLAMAVYFCLDFKLNR